MKKRANFYLGKDTRHTPSPCLDCGKVLDAGVGVGHRSKPKPGDITICMDCGHIQAYGWDMRFRPLTGQEMHDIAGDPAIIVTQEALSAYAKFKKSKG